MINHILIRDFAIIENTEIDLKDGLNVITGETGAGKSIVVEAISLALGSRADSSFVRNGKEKAVIQLALTLDGEEHILTREISSEGKNLCRVDGSLTTLSELSDLASKVAEIHGQYDNRLLMDENEHLALIDRYGASSIAPLMTEFTKAYEDYKKTRAEMEMAKARSKELAEKRDLYSFQLKEIEDIDPRVGEDEELKNRISILQNSEKIFRAIDASDTLLEGSDDSILEKLGVLSRRLMDVKQYSTELAHVAGSVEQAYLELQDTSSAISVLKDQLDFSPGELDRSISRLEELDNLISRHGGTLEQVLSKKEELSSLLDDAENIDIENDALLQETKEKLSILKERSQSLTEQRKIVAEGLSSKIKAELADLNFHGADFSIEMESSNVVTSHGQDVARMMISTNPGEPLKPLVKVASGGELSRIMLAIRNITGGSGGIPTMIFDEIDSGISGLTASIVGKKLRSISEDHQIVCITHLPQIAAAADHNLRIYKETVASSTYTHVESLDGEARINEIARLLGGETITQTARDNALELMKSSR